MPLRLRYTSPQKKQHFTVKPYSSSSAWRGLGLTPRQTRNRALTNFQEKTNCSFPFVSFFSFVQGSFRKSHLPEFLRGFETVGRHRKPHQATRALRTEASPKGGNTQLVGNHRTRPLLNSTIWVSCPTRNNALHQASPPPWSLPQLGGQTPTPPA